MHARRGLSLVEVLVAMVLLAIGIGSALSALLSAAQLRLRASAREAVAAAAEERLTWFAARSCSASDTVWRSGAGSAVTGSWRVTADSTGARLEGRAVRWEGAHAARLDLVAQRRCG
jgi:prepilin-type N-terminal cleavage/methylation domain-containing protein